MSLADLLPVRLGRLDRPARKHRAIDEVDRLRQLLDGAHKLIRGLQLQLAERDTVIEQTAGRQAEAEEIVVTQLANLDDLHAENDELRAELHRYRARFGPQLAAEANANAVTVPLAIRPVDGPEDEATAPIDVKPLWDALGIRPVTHPGRTA